VSVGWNGSSRRELAELIVSQGDEKILESHRREIVVVFCDLRGYTAFTETAEPEEVLDFLREYHGTLGPLVAQFEGTFDQFSGDGIMVFFNDPVPCPDPAERAVKIAICDGLIFWPSQSLPKTWIHVYLDRHHRDFRIIRDNLAGGNRSTRGRLVPYCMFTEPPLARVGLSEREAQQQGVGVRIARLPMTGVRRTATTDETQGFMKVLVGASDDRILGFTMIGAEAGEVMAVVQTAILADLPYPKLRDAILAHPTMAEGLGDLLAKVPPRSGP
jgi:hypothetical protein